MLVCLFIKSGSMLFLNIHPFTKLTGKLIEWIWAVSSDSWSRNSIIFLETTYFITQTQKNGVINVCTLYTSATVGGSASCFKPKVTKICTRISHHIFFFQF